MGLSPSHYTLFQESKHGDRESIHGRDYKHFTEKYEVACVKRVHIVSALEKVPILISLVYTHNNPGKRVLGPMLQRSPCELRSGNNMDASSSQCSGGWVLLQTFPGVHHLMLSFFETGTWG